MWWGRKEKPCSTLTRIRCRWCDDAVNREEGRTRCHCGGVLADSVVVFEESLPKKDLMLSYEHARKCDLFVVVDASLVVPLLPICP
jgi:NAD-dependent SIR2 family protein deacetylase